MRPGELIANRFEVLERVGAGAMGVVYKSLDRHTGEVVALKVLTERANEHAVRFAREVALLVELVHPGIVRHVAHGATAEGVPFLAMEWLSGNDLSREIRQRALEPEEGVNIVLRAAQALAVAHRRGIVHRDLKPSNLFLVDGRVDDVRLLDFGIAFSATADPLTRAGGVLGTPGYMAPEQARGRQAVDVRADVYALGCVLFRCLTGRLPFAGDDALAVMMMTMLEDAPRAQSLRADVSDDLDQLVADMLAKAPAARPADADAVASRIASLASIRRKPETATRVERRRTNLRPLPTSFLGREADLSRLHERLSTARLVTLLGAGGTGKTRLAIRYGERIMEGAPTLADGGVWFCDLTEAQDLGGICRAVASALDVPLAGHEAGSDSVGRLADAITARGRALLILDNCEQIVSDVARALERWLELAPQTHFLATSREVLRVRGEHVLELGPLSLPEEGGDIATSEAVRLFVDRASFLRPEYRLGPEEAPLVAEIVRQLDGLPLAIELAAARLGVLGERAMLERLPRRFELLAGGARDASARQRTMHGTIEWSWNLLEPWEKEALAQCSVFRGGFALDAAEHTLDLEDAPNVLDALQALHDKSLLRSYDVHGRATEKRYALFESIRAFAQEKLEAAGSRKTTLDRHAAYYLRVGNAWAERAVERGDLEALDRLALELENLMSVHRHVRGGGDELRAMLVLEPILSTRGPGEVYLALFDAPIDAEVARAAGPSALGRVIFARARARMLRGSLAEARADSEEALSLGRAGHDAWVEGRALGVLGVLDELEGHVERSLRRFAEARDCHHRAGNTRWEMTSVYNVGTLHLAAGRRTEARACFEAALQGFRRSGDRGGAANVAIGMAVLLQELGELEGARALLEGALPDLRTHSERQRYATAVGYLATVQHERGETTAARARYEEAIALFAQLGNRQQEGLFLAELGALLARADQVAAAKEIFERATAVLVAVGAPSLLSVLQVHRGHLDLANGRAGPPDGANAHRAEARARLPPGDAAVPKSNDFRFAVRMLERALDATAAGPSQATAKGDGLEIGPEGRWFRAPGGDRVDISRARQIRRILLVLAAHRRERPGEPLSVDALLHAAWPGERFAVARSGAMRVYMQLSRLRSLGLREILRNVGDGYLLDPRVEVREAKS